MMEVAGEKPPDEGGGFNSISEEDVGLKRKTPKPNNNTDNDFYKPYTKPGYKRIFPENAVSADFIVFVESIKQEKIGNNNPLLLANLFKNEIKGVTNIRRINANKIGVTFSQANNANNFLKNEDFLTKYDYKAYIPARAVEKIGVLRENVYCLFECFCEVSPGGNGREPSIVRKFPDTYNNEAELKQLPKFTFPCEFENSLIQHYSFVLTSVDSKYTFCFCRYDPRSKTSMVLLSHLPWHDIFFRLLNFLSPLLHSNDKTELISFLTACRIRPPMPGHTLNVTYNAGHCVFTCECPDKSLPTIPENSNLTEFFSALDSRCMAGLWAALLHERRIAIVATKPSRLSATVQAANAILYPMSWQHIFIPILPKHLVDYLLAPMPFLIGVPRSVMEHVRLSEIGDVVILDADANDLKTSFNDLEALPSEVATALRKALSDKNVLGDGVARAFLRALVYLIGGYRNAIRIEKRKMITFNPEEFVKTRKNMQPFLQKILQSQIFQQFIEERLELLNSGRGFSDEFELECYNFAEKVNGGSGQRLKQQYRDWAKAMKREGGAILKTVKDKANPAVKSAVDSVRQGGRNVKSAVKGFRMKMPKHGSRSSSANTMDDSRFSYGSATPVSSGSSDSLRSQSSSRSAPLTPPVMPLDLLQEMQLHFSSPVAASTTKDMVTKVSKVSNTLPPRLPQRPSIPGRYPIVPTMNLLNLLDSPQSPPRMHPLNLLESPKPLPTRNLFNVSESPQPPPRAGISRGNSQFSSEITRNTKASTSSASPMHFTQVFPDGKRLEAPGVAQRKLSLWKAEQRTPIRNGDTLKASLSAPPSVTQLESMSVPLREPASISLRPARPTAIVGPTPIPKHVIDKVPPREASDSSLDLIQLSDSSIQSAGSLLLTLEDFDPLRRNTDSNPAPASSSDRDLLQEYGLDFSRFGLDQPANSSTDIDLASQSRASVPGEWTTFN